MQPLGKLGKRKIQNLSVLLFDNCVWIHNYLNIKSLILKKTDHRIGQIWPTDHILPTPSLRKRYWNCVAQFITRNQVITLDVDWPVSSQNKQFHNLAAKLYPETNPNSTSKHARPIGRLYFMDRGQTSAHLNLWLSLVCIIREPTFCPFSILIQTPYLGWLRGIA